MSFYWEYFNHIPASLKINSSEFITMSNLQLVWDGLINNCSLVTGPKWKSFSIKMPPLHIQPNISYDGNFSSDLTLGANKS